MQCKRCNRECQPSIGNPEARLLKRAKNGYCADCALTIFLKQTEPLNMLIRQQGVEVLRHKGIINQLSNLLVIGKSDATIDEIDFERLIANWDLPIK